MTTVPERAAPIVTAAGLDPNATLTNLLNSLLAVVEPLVATAQEAIAHGDYLYRNTAVEQLQNAGRLAALASLLAALDARVTALETP